MTGSSRGWTTAGLLGLCLSLGVVVAFELWGSIPIAPQVTAAARPGLDMAQATDLPVFEPPSPDRYADIIERPLFSPTRRPFVPDTNEAPVEAPVQAEPAVPLELIGVLITTERRAALVQPQGESKASWVREGERFAGWSIEAIEDGQIRIRSGARSELVALRADRPVPRTVQRRPRRDKEPVAARAQGSQDEVQPEEEPGFGDEIDQQLLDEDLIDEDIEDAAN